MERSSDTRGKEGRRHLDSDRSIGLGPPSEDERRTLRSARGCGNGPVVPNGGGRRQSEVLADALDVVDDDEPLSLDEPDDDPDDDPTDVDDDDPRASFL